MVKNDPIKTKKNMNNFIMKLVHNSLTYLKTNDSLIR
jgi:hypothetical protein